MVDFYLNERRHRERLELMKLVGWTDELVRAYVREATRLNPQVGGCWLRGRLAGVLMAVFLWR